MEQDRQLLSLVAPGQTDDELPVWLKAPDRENFLKNKVSFSAFCVTNLMGRVVLGDEWLVAPAAAAAWRDKYEQKILLAYDPIAPIAIFIGAIKINHLRDAARRTSQLANQLLALSRADACSLDVQPLLRVDRKDFVRNPAGGLPGRCRGQAD